MIGSKTAEDRLREINKDFTYLTRESDIRKGKFILSWLSEDGFVKHTVAPNPSARKNFKTLEEAFPVIEKMILSNSQGLAVRPSSGQVPLKPLYYMVMLCCLDYEDLCNEILYFLL